MKLLAMSDLHGHLPVVTKPYDVICIAGDVVPLATISGRMADTLYKQAKWLITDFYPWIDSLPCDRVVMTWGNHDWIGMEPSVCPVYMGDKLQVLVDDPYSYNGVHFWGTPWQPVFHDWAFNLPEFELAERWGRIPKGTDVLIVHGPPKTFGDRVGREYVGSASLAARIRRIEPSYVICGHIHHGYGHYRLQGKTNKTVNILNCSIVNGKYAPVNEPVEFTVGEGTDENQ